MSIEIFVNGFVSGALVSGTFVHLFFLVFNEITWRKDFDEPAPKSLRAHGLVGALLFGAAAIVWFST